MFVGTVRTENNGGFAQGLRPASVVGPVPSRLGEGRPARPLPRQHPHAELRTAAGPVGLRRPGAAAEGGRSGLDGRGGEGARCRPSPNPQPWAGVHPTPGTAGGTSSRSGRKRGGTLAATASDSTLRLVSGRSAPSCFVAVYYIFRHISPDTLLTHHSSQAKHQRC